MTPRTRPNPARIGSNLDLRVLFALLWSLLPSVGRSQSISAAAPPSQARSELRVEAVPIEGGAELLTVFGRVLPSTGATPDLDVRELPLLSVLRDTLGSPDPEVHRLRYVWVHSYTRPTPKQRSAAGVPFLYSGLVNKRRADSQIPPPLLDLSSGSSSVGKRLAKIFLRNIVFDSRAALIKGSAFTYFRNQREFRQAHLIRALEVFSLLEADRDRQRSFSTSELHHLQARLVLSDALFGGWLDQTRVERVYQKQNTRTAQIRARNWELLRQRAEEEGLYFDPLLLPDGTATHALLWVARADAINNLKSRFDGRFLSIQSPWRDARLSAWKGEVAVRYFDSENRIVSAETPQARAVELIPLALYGLDYPKIPVLLVDFRHPLNAKRRELSQRFVDDVARNVLSLSTFGNFYYGTGKASMDFVTRRRGADISQQTRLSACSQLKLLLSLDTTLDPELRNNISRRLERVALNPMENDLGLEFQLARDQYEALLRYARDPDGLATRLALDRRKERTHSVHGGVEKTLLQMANILTFGLYTHREKADPELVALLEAQRRTESSTYLLREALQSSPRPEIDRNAEALQRALRYLAENRGRDRKQLVGLAAQLFAVSRDESIRELCLESLHSLGSSKARKQLLHIAHDTSLDSRWRERSAELLGLAMFDPPHTESGRQTISTSTSTEVGGN